MSRSPGLLAMAHHAHAGCSELRGDVYQAPNPTDGGEEPGRRWHLGARGDDDAPPFAGGDAPFSSDRGDNGWCGREPRSLTSRLSATAVLTVLI